MDGETSTEEKRTNRVRRMNRVVGAAIIVMGFGLASPLGIWDSATRRLLAERCWVSMSESSGTSSEWLNDQLDRCSNKLNWGLFEGFMNVVEKVSFGGFAFLALFVIAGFGHARFARRRDWVTLGERLTDVLTPHSSKKVAHETPHSFDPPRPFDTPK